MNLAPQRTITLDPMIELSLWGLNSGDVQPVDDHSKDDPMMPKLREDGWAFDNLEELVAFLQCRRGIS